MSIDGNFHIPSTFPNDGQMKTDANEIKKKITRSDRNDVLSSGIIKKGVSLNLVPFFRCSDDICVVCQVE